MLDLAAAQAKQGLAEALAISAGLKLTKDLANLPGNLCTPTYLAEQALAQGLDEAAARQLYALKGRSARQPTALIAASVGVLADLLPELDAQARAIVTALTPLPAFYPAEAYHQNYLAQHLTQPYIVYNDLPKLEALKAEFPEWHRMPASG